jgi:hypothetical protein
MKKEQETKIIEEIAYNNGHDDGWTERDDELKKTQIHFNDFMECNESGRFIINKYWLEYLLNLFYQGYIGEVWEEVMDTKIKNGEMIENLAYGTIGTNFNKDNGSAIVESISVNNEGFNKLHER